MAEIPVFRLADLTRNRAKAATFDAGAVGLLGPDQDPDDFTPISPWVAFARAKERLGFLQRTDIAKLDARIIDDVALTIGREIVASAFFPGTALCSEDMATCGTNPNISPVAVGVDLYTNVDVAVLRNEIEHVARHIDQLHRRG